MRRRFGGGSSFSIHISMRGRGVWRPLRRLRRLGSEEWLEWRVRRELLDSQSAEVSRSLRRRPNRVPKAAEFGGREEDAKGQSIPIRP